MGKTAPAMPAPSGSKAESAIKEGMRHYDQGHWDIAKKHFEQAVQADERSAEGERSRLSLIRKPQVAPNLSFDQRRRLPPGSSDIFNRR